MRKKKGDRRGHLEGAYLFKDKDPIIDVLRTGLQDYAKRRGITLAKAIREVCELAGVTVSCVHGWLFGSVGKPYFWSACAIGICARIRHFDQFIPERERAKIKLIIDNTKPKAKAA